MIVVDASVLVNALADDGPEGKSTRRRLLDVDIHTPHIVDLEFTSGIRRRQSAGMIDERRAAEALQDLQDLPAVRYAHFPLLDRIWELRYNVTPYDAAYIALAEALDCTLLTGDRRLARSTGVRCEVELL